MNDRISRSITIGLLGAMLVATSSLAQEAPAPEDPATAEQQRSRDWTLRFGFLVANTTGGSSVSAGPGAAEVRLNGGGGGFVNLEYRTSPLLGIELNLIGMGTNLNVSTGVGRKHTVYSDVDFLTMGSIAIGANFHFVRDGKIDVYAGPLLAFNRYTDIAVRSGFHHGDSHKHDEWSSVRWRDDSEVTWGAKAGLDILLGKKQRWSVGFGLTYMDATYTFEDESDSGSSSISFNPVMLSIGGGFRF
jgi:outer membrane protein W